MNSNSPALGSEPANQKVRRLGGPEKWATFVVSLSLGPFLAKIFPFFDGDFEALNSQGLIPAFVAYEIACTLLAGAIFWLLTYALRRAATSPLAPRWLTRGMASVTGR